MALSVSPGNFYETRDGRSAFVLELHSVPWAYNGQPREWLAWRGLIEDKPCMWELDGASSPVVQRLLPSGALFRVEAETDLVKAL